MSIKQICSKCDELYLYKEKHICKNDRIKQPYKETAMTFRDFLDVKIMDVALAYVIYHLIRLAASIIVDRVMK